MRNTSFNNCFDKILVVWGGDIERKEHIEKHFSSLDITNYVLVKNIPIQKIVSKSPTRNIQKIKCTPCIFTDTQHNYPMTLAEICCCFGHIKCFKYALDNNYQTVLIVEDDIVFDTTILNQYKKWKKYIPKKWDIIHFHSWRDFNTKREPELIKGRKLINPYFYTGFCEWGGAVCYALNTSSLKILYSIFYPIITAADGMIQWFSDNPIRRRLYNSYLFYPFLCNTRFESQIDKSDEDLKIYTRRERYSRGGFDPNIL